MSGDVVGIVLVAGLSERFGHGVTKQLLHIGDRTMAAVAVANAEASQLDRVIAVTGNAAADVAASLDEGRAEIAHNPSYEEGNLSSLRTGLAAAGDLAAAVVLLGDTPEVGPDIIDRMVAVWRDRAPWAAHAVYDDGLPSHPFLLSADAVAVVRALAGSKPLWSLLVEAPPEPVMSVRHDRAPPVDVDTASDHAEVLRRLGAEQG